MGQQFHISFDEMWLMDSQSSQLGGAHGREIAWMREDDDPAENVMETTSVNPSWN